MKVYLAGGMRGYPSFNYPAFDAAAARLRAAGHEVFNPAEHDRGQYGDLTPENADAKGFDLRKALAADLTWITLEADGVAVLDGWQASLGARAEVATALALGLPVQPVATFGDKYAWRIREVPPLSAKKPDPVLNDLQAWLNRTHREAGPLYKGGVPVIVDSAAEVRSVSSTGGAKGEKAARYDLIPTHPLRLLAEHYGKGLAKYQTDDGIDNWRRGYEWRKSYAALQRHANQFWSGEDVDPETGSPHLIAVAWHAFALVEWARHASLVERFDDRQDCQEVAA